MKKLITFLAFIATTAIFAQAPQGFNYQATVRNSTGQLLLNQNVLVKFNVLQNSATGTIVYSENQTVTTDDLGHINLVVGQGTATTGTFSTINWGTANYYLGIELNTGSGYLAMGTTQLLSVPYALYSNSSGNAPTPTLANGTIFVGNVTNQATSVALSGDVTITNTGAATIANNAVTTAKIANANVTNAKLDKANIPLSGFGAATADVNLGAKKITNLADPINAQDAVTKAYLAANATNLVSGTTNGDLLYWNGTQWAVLSAPQNNSSLKWCNGQLIWGNCPGNFTSHIEAQNFYTSSVLPALEGPYGGTSDIPGLDPGNSNYVRNNFNLNEVPTDLAYLGWVDEGIPDLVKSTWLPTNTYVKGMYLRLNKMIEKSNEFIRKSDDIKFDPIVRQLIGEARFMRAVAYYSFIDLYGRAPIVTEATVANPTTQNTRQELFNFVESELLVLEDIFNDPLSSVASGRLSKAAPQALLSRLYLNAQSFIGVPKFTQCIQKLTPVLYGNYHSLSDNDLNSNGSKYDELFLADNGETSAKEEFIFSIKYKGLQADNTPLINYGGTTFLTNAGANSVSNTLTEYGVTGWGGGLRTRKNLVQKFTTSITAVNNNQDPIAWSDKRANFFTSGATYNDATNFYGVKKWVNKKINNQNGSHPTFVDVDFPVIRVAEIYLNYVEAHLRGGGGDVNTATFAINTLRARSNAAAITPNDLNLNFVLDERARELYWECLRRTDLVRYNLFTGGQYLWPLKGGTVNGASTESFRNLYPIPQDVITANPGFVQNPGY
jgi:hypothetical protein